MWTENGSDEKIVYPGVFLNYIFEVVCVCNRLFTSGMTNNICAEQIGRSLDPLFQLGYWVQNPAPFVPKTFQPPAILSLCFPMVWYILFLEPLKFVLMLFHIIKRAHSEFFLTDTFNVFTLLKSPTHLSGWNLIVPLKWYVLKHICCSKHSGGFVFLFLNDIRYQIMAAQLEQSNILLYIFVCFLFDLINIHGLRYIQTAACQRTRGQGCLIVWQP